MGQLDLSKKLLLGLLGFSVIELWHAAEICDSATHCEGMLGWGVAAGAVSTFIALVWGLVSHFVEGMDAHTKWVALFLALWWIAAVCSLTMPNNSKNCGNNLYCQGLFLDVSN